MAVSRFRVELRNLPPHASKEERDRAFKIMLGIFKKQVNSAKILTRYNDHQVFESPGEKQRRKRKAAASQRKRDLKDNLREHFG